MNQTPTSLTSLTQADCRARQRRLLDRAAAKRVDGVLVADPRYVHYLTAYHWRPIFAPLAWLDADGSCTLIAPLEPDAPVAADRVTLYASNRRATLNDHQPLRAIEAAAGLLSNRTRIGVDGPLARGLLDRPAAAIDLSDDLLALRRRKHDDELAILRWALRGAEAAYEAARPLLEPGVCETHVWATMQAAAAEAVGETLGEFGNDFQIGALGSAPRRREARRGEMAVLDLGVAVRGYVSDMCRSFVIGGQASDAQRTAYEAVVGILDRVERQARPGTRCAELHADALDRLNGLHGWSFEHHLGHGIGLNNHEAPRLNVECDDTLAEGDVFTVEPGLYGGDLRAGLRIEQVYRVTGDGVERLTRYPTDIT